MSVLSDASANSLPEGFKSYLTGYPLLDSSYYVISRTWEAKDVKRPGAVWTHSLLVPFVDLPNINDIEGLQGLLAVPAAKLNTRSFRKSIQLVPTPNANLGQIRKDFLNQLIPLLFGETEKPIILSAPTSAHLENLVMTIWASQWPKLRRTFTFSTGSVTLRKLDGRMLDLQIVPNSAVSQGRLRGVPDFSVFIFEPDTYWTEPWIEAGAEAFPVSSENHRIVQRWGADLPGKRSLYGQLFRILAIYNRTNSKNRVSELIEVLAETFPDKQSARQVKFDLVGPHASSFASISEKELLLELILSPFATCLDGDDLKIEQRACEAFSSGSLNIDRIFPKIRDGVFFEQVMLGYASSLTPIGFAGLISTHPILSSFVLKLNPLLATHEASWPRSGSAVEAMVRAVFPAFSDSMLEALFSAFYETRLDVLIEFCRQGGKDATWILLQTMDTFGVSESHFEVLKRALEDVVGDTVSWLNSRTTLSDSCLHLLAELFNSGHMLDQRVTHALSITNLLAITNYEVADAVAKPSAIWAFTLKRAVSEPTAEGIRLALRSFGPLCYAAKSNSLPYSVFFELDQWLPSLGLFGNWDVCRRLAMALVNSFDSDALLLEAGSFLPDPDLLDMLR
jgi:hypothetical protein